MPDAGTRSDLSPRKRGSVPHTPPEEASVSGRAEGPTASGGDDGCEPNGGRIGGDDKGKAGQASSDGSIDAGAYFPAHEDSSFMQPAERSASGQAENVAAGGGPGAGVRTRSDLQASEGPSFMPHVGMSRSGPGKGASEAERIRGLGPEMCSPFWALAEDGSGEDGQEIDAGAIHLGKLPTLELLRFRMETGWYSTPRGHAPGTRRLANEWRSGPWTVHSWSTSSSRPATSGRSLWTRVPECTSGPRTGCERSPCCPGRKGSTCARPTKRRFRISAGRLFDLGE